MQGESLSLSKSSLAYAKLAATPTDTAWSQVYNAGNLFACLSLTVSGADEDHPLLQTLGKELLNNLEAEFFTLEEKNPTTITQAIEKSTKHIPESVSINFCLAFFKEHILYLFLLGPGRVIMKRQEKLGVLLENDAAMLKTASGYLKNGDIIILETNQFAQNISEKNLSEALQLNLPSDIAETLSVPMHAKGDGDQAAIIIAYHGIGQPTPAATTTPEPDDNLQEEEPVRRMPEPQRYEDEQEEDVSSPRTKRSSPFLSFGQIGKALSHIKLPALGGNNRRIVPGLSHRKKFFLSITVVIFLLLIVSIFLTKQKQENSKTSALFQSIYQPAFKNYDDAKSLKGLNDDLSHEDLLKAETELKEGQNKFPKDSKENKQLQDLLTKVEAELGPTANTPTTSVKEVKVADTDLLAVEKTNSGNGFSQDGDKIYYVTDSAITAVTKSDEQKKDIIKNDSDWDKAVGIAPYEGNLYVLDQKNGVIKYTAASDAFGKSSYFKSPAPDVSKAVAIAIDSSIWILSTDGTIQKFTRGQADAFSVKSLQTPFKNPTKIYTDKDITNVYVLDNGNSRIVKLANDGTFQTEYSAPSIKQAKDFEVLEKDKKILFLSGGKIFQIDL